MIKFNFDDKGVSINSRDMKEFQENVMTTKEVVERLLKFYSKDSSYSGEQEKMLTSFFNDPNRRSLSMTEPAFDSLNYGYGVADNKLYKLIMWRDNSGLHNFAMWIKNEGILGGKLVKIYPEKDDIFTKNQMEGALYLAELNKTSYFKGCDKYADNYVYQTKLQELDKEIENIKNQRKCCKNEMKTIKDRYKELLTSYAKMKVEQVKLQIEKETLISQHKK